MFLLAGFFSLCLNGLPVWIELLLSLWCAVSWLLKLLYIISPIFAYIFVVQPSVGSVDSCIKSSELHVRMSSSLVLTLCYIRSPLL